MFLPCGSTAFFPIRSVPVWLKHGTVIPVVSAVQPGYGSTFLTGYLKQVIKLKFNGRPGAYMVQEYIAMRTGDFKLIGSTFGYCIG